jgi:flagellar hook-associated protein 3 FlgL
MRITNQMIVRGMLRDIERHGETLASKQELVATGNRIGQVSDDPVDAGRLIRLDATLRATEQYRRNAASARTRLAVEEQIIESVRDLVARVKGIALGVSADSPTDPSRVAALTEASQILDSIIALGNTQLGGEFILGGAETADAPFASDGTYVGDATQREVELDQGVYLKTNHPGDQLLDGTIQALKFVIQELQNGTEASIQTAGVALGGAEDGLLASQAEVGGRVQAVDDAERLHASRATTLLSERDNLQRVDPAAAAVELVSAQQAMERAYAAIGRILDMSLLDYLR